MNLFGALPFTLQLLRFRLNREADFTTSLNHVKGFERQNHRCLPTFPWRTPASMLVRLSGTPLGYSFVNDLRFRKCLEVTVYEYSKRFILGCQGQIERFIYF